MNDITKFAIGFIIVAFILLVVMPFSISLGFLIGAEDICEDRGMSVIDRDIINTRIMCSDGTTIDVKGCSKLKTCVEKNQEGSCTKIERVWKCK